MGTPVSPWNTIVPVGQDKLHFPIQHKRLGTELLTHEKLLDQVVVSMGVLLHLFIGVGDVLWSIDSGDTPTARGVHTLEDDRIADLLTSPLG